MAPERQEEALDTMGNAPIVEGREWDIHLVRRCRLNPNRINSEFISAEREIFGIVLVGFVYLVIARLAWTVFVKVCSPPPSLRAFSFLSFML